MTTLELYFNFLNDSDIDLTENMKFINSLSPGNREFFRHRKHVSQI